MGLIAAGDGRKISKKLTNIWNLEISKVALIMKTSSLASEPNYCRDEMLPA